VNGGPVFLRKREGVTLDTIEREQVAQAREVDAVAERERKFRERQRKVPVMLSDVYGERFSMTLRDAARRVLDSGGAIESGDHDELRVMIPALLTGEPMLEADAKRPLVNAAELLIAARRVVLAEVERAESDRPARKQRLDERLPTNP
jgi:hypothetical protein